MPVVEEFVVQDEVVQEAVQDPAVAVAEPMEIDESSKQVTITRDESEPEQVCKETRERRF